MKMKLFTILFPAALLAATSLYAQAPVNDDFNCATMIDLGIAPACPPTVFTNVNATPSVIATVDTVSCFNSATAQRDVWFKFTCSDTLFDYRIILRAGGGTPIANPEFALYRGDCQFDGLGEIGCVSAQPGQDSIFFDLFDLTPNEVYYIRVSDWSATAAPNSGQFTLCVEEIPPIVTIDQGSSSLCSGTLYDSGGANGDYSPNENYTFVICPDQPSECISFTLDYYNLEPSLPGFAGDGDQLSFYDGTSVNSPLLASLDGNGGNPQDIAGGGGVCFHVQAKSGCLTVAFKSDGSVQESGWKGTWQCSSDPCPTEEQIAIDTVVTNSDLEGAVSTGGAMVTVSSINCPQGAMGLFSYPSDNNDLQLEKGLLLTSGQALDVAGANSFFTVSNTNPPFFTDDPGDADLQYLSNEYGNGSTSYDVCSVELDVFAATNEVVFEYVFGSEEYPEFVWANTGYNDIFAFLVSGPGIVGDPNLSNNAMNIATLPGSGTFVQIDSVNNQVNWQYYRNNELSNTLTYDGLTSDYLGVKKSLTARVPVIPCNTYHLKLAIADRGDEAYDSGVFVSEIKAGSPDVNIAFASGLKYFIETCTGTNDTLFITLDKVPTVPTTFNITLGGSATAGVDYTLNIPPSITFQPGQQTLAFPIIPIPDALMEGTETITITLSHDYGCGEVALKTVTVDLLDNVDVNIAGGDTLKVCAGDFVQLNATGATTYLWEPTDAVSNPYIPDPVAQPAQSEWLYVTGVVGSCTDKDSVYLRVVAPTISVSALTPNVICQGGSVQLQAVSSEPTVSWSPTNGLDDPNSLTPVASPDFPVTYTASVTLEGCTVDDAITVTVDSLFFPTLINDTTLCQNYPVQLANMLSSSSTYSWSPANGLDNPGVSGPIATPGVTTTYVLTATSPNGACTKKDTVTVSIIPANVEISGADSIYLCLGTSIQLNANTTPSGATVLWSPADFLSASTGDSVTATPTETVTIHATYVTSGCTVYDSVYLRVDSLPELTIHLNPDKPFYCPGDTIYMLSNIYEPANYPGIEHYWEPFGTMLTPLDQWNMIVIASDSNLYKRTTHIGGCIDTATVFVPVPQPPDLPFTVTPDSICPGETAQIVVMPNPPNTTLKWEPNTAATLSCDDCPNPVASPLATTTYHVTTPDAQCPGGQDITVQVKPLPPLQLASNPASCHGEPVVLNGTNDPGTTYTWTPATFLNNPGVGNPTATPTQAGVTTYHVSAIKDGCAAEGEVTLSAYYADVMVTTPAQTLCAGQALTLTANTSGSPGTLVWIPAGPDITPDSAATYIASLSYGNGCLSQDSVHIDVKPSPTLALMTDPMVCLGESAGLNAVIMPNITYLWTPAIYLSDPNIGNPISTPTQTGSTTYHVVATDPASGCTNSGDVTVTAVHATVDLGPDQELCFGKAITLNAAVSGAPGGSFLWTDSLTTPSITVSPVFDRSYTVTYYYGPNNFCEARDTVAINVGALLGLSAINAPTDSVCAGAPVVLKVKITDGSGALSWFADGTAINGATLDSVIVTPQGDATSYSVILTDANGCTATSAPVSVITKKCFDIPNTFTPNGDGSNDTFSPITYEGYTEVQEFKIFNRWGQKVFEATPAAKAWDGKTDGKEAPSDVYVYKIRVKFGNGDQKTFSGEITLLR